MLFDGYARKSAQSVVLDGVARKLVTPSEASQESTVAPKKETVTVVNLDFEEGWTVHVKGIFCLCAALPLHGL